MDDCGLRIGRIEWTRTTDPHLIRINIFYSKIKHFITKPYNMQILLAHIEAVLKRSKPEISHILEYKGMKINLSKGTIDYDNQTVILTKNEIQIFSYLLERRGTVVTRDELMNYLWNTEAFIDDNTLTVNMARLRKKLEDLGFKDVIETRRGWGYIIL